jgi:hypothetical protein
MDPQKTDKRGGGCGGGSVRIMLAVRVEPCRLRLASAANHGTVACEKNIFTCNRYAVGIGAFMTAQLQLNPTCSYSEVNIVTPLREQQGNVHLRFESLRSRKDIASLCLKLAVFHWPHANRIISTTDSRRISDQSDTDCYERPRVCG